VVPFGTIGFGGIRVRVYAILLSLKLLVCGNSERNTKTVKAASSPTIFSP